MKQLLDSAGTGWNGIPPPVSGVPLPEVTIPPPNVVAPLHHLAMPFRLDGPHCIFWSVDFREVITTVATGGADFKA